MNKTGIAIEATSDDVKIEGVPVPQAYKALSQEAFAIWIRMHCMAEAELAAGRGKLAKVFGLSEGRSNVIIRELVLKGYLAADSKGPPHPTAFKLAKRCKLVGRNQFIRLSGVLRSDSGAYTDPIENGLDRGSREHRRTAQISEVEAMTNPTQPWFDTNGAPVDAGMLRTTVASEDEHWHIPVFIGSKAIPIVTGSNTDGNADREHRRTAAAKAARTGTLASGADSEHTRTVPKIGALNAAKASKKNANLIGSNPKVGSDCNQSPLSPNSSRKGLDLSRMREAKKGTVERKRDVLTTAPRHPETGQPINWDKLDLVGKPVISFSPSRERREVMLRLLGSEYRRLKPAERKLRTALVDKLRSEFIRIYTRYRRAANLESGRLRCQYMVAPQEGKFAERAAIACLMKGVTPRELLEYWHANIKHFKGGVMSVPSLTFLSQPSFVDEVAVNGLRPSGDDGVDASGSKSPAGGGARRLGWRPPPRRTPHLGDTAQLHPKLRAGLMEAGFSLSKYNDSDLATIQDYAIEVMGGTTGIGLIPEALRPMIEWAIKNTLKDCDPRDFAWRG